ncbi:hypothetical protein [Aquimarina sp. 2304DJ70-9]|uniref:hypothetical protein n=1 Tax=Aquimarina penaris TaxID=3231044 RepID=UPI003462318C
MTKFEYHKIVKIEENSPLENRLYNLFKAAISDEVSIAHFRKLFTKYDSMDMHIMMKNGKDIGMSYFMYCKNPEYKKDLYIRLGIGIIKEERGGSFFPKSLILKTMLKARLKYLFTNIYMVAITMNPIVYVATCKYWKYTYPNPIINTPQNILELKNRTLDHFMMNEIEEDIIGIPFSMPGIEDAKKKFADTESDNAFIKYFATRVNAEETDRGLLTFIPVDFINLFIVVFRKTRTDVMRFINKILEENGIPIFEEYSPIR